MNRRGFLHALWALPAAAAAAPLLKLVPEPIGPIVWETPNYDAFMRAAWRVSVLNPRTTAYISGLEVPALLELPVIEDTLCPPNRIYLEALDPVRNDLANILSDAVNHDVRLTRRASGAIQNRA